MKPQLSRTVKIVGVLLSNDNSATQALDFMHKYINQTNQKPDILPGITLELVHHTFTGTGNSFSGLQKSKFIHRIYSGLLEFHSRSPPFTLSYHVMSFIIITLLLMRIPVKCIEMNTIACFIFVNYNRLLKQNLLFSLYMTIKLFV